MNNKTKFLREFNEAFVRNDADFLSTCITDDVYWNVINDQVFDGAGAFIKGIRSMKSDAINKLEIHHIITHGNEAAVNGNIEMKFSNGKISRFAFCDIYVLSGFKNPKVKKLTSYVMEL
jgi:ketosteroid isomerase-like protein